MAKFTTLTSRVIPLLVDNIDTDQIIPARFLKVIDKDGLGKNLFADWRYDAAGKDNPDFVLNQAEHAGAQVLLAGDNFGCGSSREHAPWALCGFGLRAVISTSFADIFRSNALKNGLLPVVVEPRVHEELVQAVRADRATSVKIDLSSATLTLPSGKSVSFPVDAFSQHCLLNGLDQLGYILSFEERIRTYEASHGA
jgi:3-isopropylmalate/(R)-2-methylmalate dehydratase small subunit